MNTYLATEDGTLLTTEDGTELVIESGRWRSIWWTPQDPAVAWRTGHLVIEPIET